MTASAAENPCVPNWVWSWAAYPTLEISCPDALPDTCVGHHTISATVTAVPGVKCQYDANDCPDSPACINQTYVPITPVNTWSLYVSPSGTTPTSGSGLAAVFDTIHGGYARVYFNSQATVISPYWHQAAGCYSSLFRVFEVVDLTPDHGTEVDDGDGNPDTKLFIVCGTLVPPSNTGSIAQSVGAFRKIPDFRKSFS